MFECKGHRVGDLSYPSFHGTPKDNTLAVFKILPQATKIQNLRDEFHSNPCDNCYKINTQTSPGLSENSKTSKRGTVTLFACLGHMKSYHGDFTEEHILQIGQ